MKTYEFDLIGCVVDPIPDDFDNRLYEAGCDDATIILCKGRVTAAFDREAASLEEAISSAIRDAKAGGMTVGRIEIDPSTLL